MRDSVAQVGTAPINKQGSQIKYGIVSQDGFCRLTTFAKQNVIEIPILLLAKSVHRDMVYRYGDGRREERLRLGAELFNVLLELAGGY